MSAGNGVMAAALNGMAAKMKIAHDKRRNEAASLNKRNGVMAWRIMSA